MATKVRHIPRKYGGGYGRLGIFRARLAVTPPGYPLVVHPLSMRAAAERRAAEAAVKALEPVEDKPTTRRTGKTAKQERAVAARKDADQ